ncbi:NAD(P)/FAD-dependent oxidoreductase [Candidatus Hydrogenedentota bacterium]
MKVLDLIIIGAGPAGITASIYAARKRMDFLVLTNDIGGQAESSGVIENYTGYKFITGPELVTRFKEHLVEFNVDVHEDEPVTSLKKTGNLVIVKTVNGEYHARSAIIATGRKPRELDAEGEAEFRHKGLTYCATCDAPLFANVDIAVVGGGNSALDAVLQSIKIARTIHLVHRRNEFRADSILLEKARESDNVVFHTQSNVTRVYGNVFVEGIVISKDGEEEELPVRGVLVEVGSVPISGFVNCVDKNKYGDVAVNCKCETSVPAIFAAGDVTDVFGKQIIVACGEGVKATLSAFEYLSRSRD